MVLRRGILQGAVLALVGCGRSPPRLPSRWGVAGLGRPRSLSTAGGGLFVIDDSPESVGGGVLFRIPLGGGLARALVFESHGLTGAAVTATALVWAVRRSGELRVATQAQPSAPRVLATRPRGFMSAMVTDGTEVYCSSPDGPTVAVPLAGGPERVIFPAPSTALSLAPDGLVFVAGGAVRWAPRRGGATAVLAPSHGVAAIAVRGAYAYWAEQARPRGTLTGSLRRVHLAGGDVETLVDGIDDPDALAVGGERAWYAGTHFVPEARVGVVALGSVTIADRRHHVSESAVAVTSLLCEGPSLYLAGAVGHKIGGVVQRRPA
ncbi:MAG: hypothetical protein IPN17_36395 [Deltaproteobacteria bacterium]|nr:hypothetical protein [Deltaproteobacteria bacterium]